MRQLTEKHTSDPRCAGCHARIDPYGFALERSTPSAGSRDKDLGNRPIDDRAKNKDGTEFDGLEGLREVPADPEARRLPASVLQEAARLLPWAAPCNSPTSRCSTRCRRGWRRTDYHVGTAMDMIVASRQFREIEDATMNRNP